ncbi:MAG: efflux RND transporter periplasmic adaptor subunit [Candidatus Latescibacteria bacterium]|nr:efflux RND transporter periplasmic adaptor subunit [Candidatus Latescibacterota bacterium]
MRNKRTSCLAGLSAALLIWVSCRSSSGAVPTYTVQRGEFVHGVTVTGELQAVNARKILAPPVSWQTALKVAKIVDDGRQVKEGDLLIQFDRSEVEKTIAEVRAELEIARADLRKTQTSARSDIEGLETDLQVSELDRQIAKLTLDQAAFEAEINRQEFRLTLDQAAIKLEQDRRDLENQRRAKQEEINKMDLKVQQAQTRLDEAEQTLAKLTVTAPAPGIAILERYYRTNAKYQVDDQPYPGAPMIGLPDLSRMKADVQVNEVDIAKIRPGQAALLKLDASPDTSFTGHVTEIATLARIKERDSKVKVFDAVVELDASGGRLMPGLTVNCQIVVEQTPSALFIPLEAVFQKEGGQIVYLQNGGGFEPRRVVLGAENDNHVIVSDGLKEGDRVAITDPTQARSREGKAGKAREKSR